MNKCEFKLLTIDKSNVNASFLSCDSDNKSVNIQFLTIIIMMLGWSKHKYCF